MIILYLAIISVIIALIRFGNLNKLAQIQIRQIWLIYVPASFIAALFIAEKLGLGSVVRVIGGMMHLVSYTVLFVLICLNRRLAGSKLLALGLVLNMIVIVANAGRMPVSYEAAKRARMKPIALELLRTNDTTKMARHEAMSSKTRLNFLADDIALTHPPFPSGEVVSPGDLALALGVFILIQAAAATKKRKEVTA